MEGFGDSERKIDSHTVRRIPRHAWQDEHYSRERCDVSKVYETRLCVHV